MKGLSAMTNYNKRLLQNMGKMLGATLFFVVISTVIGAFAFTSLLGMLGLTLGLFFLAVLLYAAILAPIGLLFGFKKPGGLLMSAAGIVGGSLAIYLIGWMLPGTVLLGGFFAAIPYAAANTGLIWLVGWRTGLRKDLTFLPQR
jgi:hypothetical protein